MTTQVQQQFIREPAAKGLAMVQTRTVVGIDAVPVAVEVHLANGLPAFSTVGLPETAVRESKDRVRGALLNSGFEFPAKRITVNLAPADLPKAGGRFDLPIAIGILLASEQLAVASIGDFELVGELALDGSLRGVNGVLPTALAADEAGRSVIVPAVNGSEAALTGASNAYAANHLLAVCAHLAALAQLPQCRNAESKSIMFRHPDMADVRGQAQARRALEIAAAGQHSLLMIGSPGSGKSMLATRLPGILPNLSTTHAREVAAIASVASGQFDPSIWRRRPFRAPHHSASAAALVGGGSNPKPGEISRAHHGVLFLDELTEFSRATLEHLREPMESGAINIARANRSVRYPAQFQLVAACNPCPCGYLGDDADRCSCSAAQVAKYQARLSGPLLDRIDMHVSLKRVDALHLEPDSVAGEGSDIIRARVVGAQQRQVTRQACLNSALTLQQLEQFCHLNAECQLFLRDTSQRLRLSARAYHRVLRLARTIADLRDNAEIEVADLAESINYRSLDRTR